MKAIKIISTGDRDLKPIVTSAIGNEMKRMEAGIRKTARRLKIFEEKYQRDTQAFLIDYENDKLEETMEFMEWMGEIRMMKRLQEKMEALKGIRIEN